MEFWWVHYARRDGMVWWILERIETAECIRQTDRNIKGNK
jgi:hypothetical protein